MRPERACRSGEEGGGDVRLAYRGESMRGTFADGDCLRVRPVRFEVLRPGDVVAFRSGGQVVAHRIVGRRGGDFLTRGDGALAPDSAALAPGALIGQVVGRERRGVETSVAGGGWGRWAARFRHGACRVRIGLLFPLAPLYRALRASRWVGRIWKPRLLAARFAVAGGVFHKRIHRGRTVACWAPHEGRWTCRKPYDLVLERPGP